MNTAIEEFRQIYPSYPSFEFDYDQGLIIFNNSAQKNEKLMLGIFAYLFFATMMTIANWGNLSLPYLGYVLSIGVVISAFMVSGKTMFTIDLDNQTFSTKTLFGKKTIVFSEIQDVLLTKTYLNFAFINNTVSFRTKIGKSDIKFLSEDDMGTAKRIVEWCQKYLQEQSKN